MTGTVIEIAHIDKTPYYPAGYIITAIVRLASVVSYMALGILYKLCRFCVHASSAVDKNYDSEVWYFLVLL